MQLQKAILDFYINNREQEMIKGVVDEKKKFEWETMINVIEELYKKFVTTIEHHHFI